MYKFWFNSLLNPERIDQERIGNFPVEYHILDVPCISYKKTYCQTAILQMVAAQRGINETIGYINFLTGATYGAAYTGGTREWFTFFPYTDTNTGYKVAAPYLGLKRRYLVTDDGDCFLKVLRYCLSQGFPVHLGLNISRLENKNFISPHNELLVGYDENNFYYYEPEEPEYGDRRIEGGMKGDKVEQQSLLLAVNDQSKVFGYPWNFALTIFEEREEVKEQDLSIIWIRNGQLIKGSRWPIPLGYFAIKKFSTNLQKVQNKIKNTEEKEEIEWVLEALPYTRFDNAAFIQDRFTGEEQILKIVDLFRQCGKYYQQSLQILKEDGIIKIKESTALLLAGANLEKKIGQILINRGKMIRKVKRIKEV